ncbi:MAG: hypothetical protein QXE97_03100 [Candidatus Aenigmatarchaeota archaeon]
MKEKKTYIKILNKMIEVMTELLGEKIVLICARRSPLLLDEKGKVKTFYGEGEIVVGILLKQFESIVGSVCHEPIKKAIKPIIGKKKVKLPEVLK